MTTSFLKQLLAVLLSCLLASALFAQQGGNTFTKVRYSGGSVASKVDPKDWGNRLTITSELIVLELKAENKGFQRVEISPKSVTSISYGLEAQRRVANKGKTIALASVSPVALLFLKHKTVLLHYIGIQYNTPGGTGGILLQGDDDNYRAMLFALQGVSAVPVSVAKEEANVPIGVNVTAAAGDVQPTPQVSSYAQTDYTAAIAYGQSFKSRLDFLEHGLSAQKVQLASAWAVDGMSKYVTFFSDFEAVAAASAQAKQEMRGFTIEDAHKVPLNGLTFAHVEIHARGEIPVMKLSKRYVRDSAHLVLEVDGKIIQPISKQLTKVSDVSIVIPVEFYAFWNFHNVSILTGGPLGYSAGKVEMEFAYQLEPSIKTKKGTVILIDANGNKHQQNVDFSKIFQ